VLFSETNPVGTRTQNCVKQKLQGLSYLHHDCQPAVIHHDLNSNNVLLDAVFEPRIADVGIAKLFDPCKDTQSMTAVAGSIGYIAPEYAYTMRVTEKSNVYSYGVILLELLTGRKPVNPSCSDATDLVAWVHSTSSRDEAPEQVLDANISTVSFKARQEMLLVLKIAILCTLVSPSERPEMKEVVNMLQPVQKAS
jgi:serine/threonine protein kinase